MVAADAVFFVIVAVTLGLLTKIGLSWTNIPYTIVMLLWGLLLGYGNMTYASDWRYFSPGTAQWQDIEPEVLMTVFLPPLLYAGAFALPYKVLSGCSVHIALLGCVGVFTGTAMTGLVVKGVLPQKWSWTQSFLFSSIVAATDPVAAVALLREVGAPEHVRVTVDGEALVDDGVAAVIYAVFLVFVEGGSASVGDIIRLLFRQSLGGPAVGVAFAIGVVALLRFGRPDVVTESGLMLAAAYAAFFVSEEIFRASGILSVVALGFAVSILDALWGGQERRADAIPYVHAVWDVLEFLFNTVAFVLSGALIARQVYVGYNEVGEIKKSDFGFAVAVWLLLLVIRAINFIAFWPILKRTGFGFTAKEAVIGVWSGLRGIVGLALALRVLDSSRVPEEGFKYQQYFFMSTTLVLTVVIQAGTLPLLLKVIARVGRDRVEESPVGHDATNGH